jgi:hypothetical protein
MKNGKILFETIYKCNIEILQRYSCKKNTEYLNPKHLQFFLSTLLEGYEFKRMDETLANEPSWHKISEDFTSQFNSIDDYINRGVGFGNMYDEQFVSGDHHSYSIYDNGIEIEVATHPKLRRKGLVSIVSSALILDCLEKGIYPNWDAAKKSSLKLAQKFGCVLDQPTI